MVILVVAAEYKVERVLIDQGSSANILYWSTVQKMQLSACLVQKCPGSLYGFAGECVPISGTVELKTSFGERSDSRTIPVLYTVEDAPASYNIIIGRPALNRLGAIVSTKHLCMKFPMGRRVGSVWADSQVAWRCYEDSLKVEKYAPADAVNALDLDLDMRSQYEHEGPHPAEDLKEIQLGCRLEQTTKIGTAMNKEEEDLLIAFLKANHDVRGPQFYVPSIVNRTGGKAYRSKEEEIGRGETRSSEGGNTQIVVSRICARGTVPDLVGQRGDDYTNLNKACPKDSYPLPSIDRLVDNVTGFSLLSFMDAYSGYNQIRMHPQDEEKTTFITDEGAFCYRVMPFGLKNAGATYQRLMDKIFQGVLGADVEVYVDDMVVKS
ncbi:hypothetical protein CR513_04038, partial [Mucuna pruriens]